MEEIAHHILSLSQEKDLPPLLKYLSHKDDLIKRRARADEIDAVLAGVITPQHSAGYVFLLAAKATTLDCKDPAGKGWQTFYHQVGALLENGHGPQIRAVAGRFSIVMEAFAEMCFGHDRPLLAIRPLHRAISHLTPSLHELTPLHHTYLHACIQSKCYHLGHLLLEHGIREVDPKQTAVNGKHFLLYHYYAGIVLVGQKRWAEAINCFKLAITAPATTLSAIAVEAYKKWILCCLIAYGRLDDLPNYTRHAVSGRLESHAQLYKEFAEAYGSQQREKLKELLSAKAELFKKDHNLGLAKQSFKAQQQQRIQSCTSTYVTLSMDQIAKNANVASSEEAESAVLKMIETKEIFASIDQDRGMVAFVDDMEGYQSVEMLQQVFERVDAAKLLNERLQDLHYRLMLNPEYVKKLVQEKSAGVWEGAPF